MNYKENMTFKLKNRRDSGQSQIFGGYHTKKYMYLLPVLPSSWKQLVIIL